MASKSAMGHEIMKADVKTNIGLTDDARKAVVEILNSRLCDEYTLYTKTRKYHWNVIGPRFHQLHEFFNVAERARHLGGKSYGTMEEFARHSSIKEDPGEYPEAQTMISNLLKDHETNIQTLRKNVEECEEKYHDTVTSNFLQDAVEKHEKMAWMLRAHLEGKGTI
jgi:starvation-inducible DNA-binding protein